MGQGSRFFWKTEITETLWLRNKLCILFSPSDMFGASAPTSEEHGATSTSFLQIFSMITVSLCLLLISHYSWMHS